jgi:Hydrazine synthase alpha subunit middle domain
MKRFIAPLTAMTLAASIALATGACSSSGSSGGEGGIGVSSIVFIKRQTTTVDSSGNVTVDVADGNNQVIDYDRYVAGGSLNLLSPARPDGNVINLTSSFPTADFNGADVSFDAQQIVFSMKRDSNDRYHIYTVQVTPDANGQYDVHQKTAGDYDDINPVYLPGGLIGFATNEMYTPMGTRADEYEHSRSSVQLATISVNGGDADRRLFAQSISHTVAPFLRHDGRISYSRWEHLGAVNDVKIFAANPDGTQMLAVAGQHNKPLNSLYALKETPTPNVMIGIGTDRERTIHAGALMQIDSRNAADPVCMDATADQTGHACLDEEHATFTNLTPNVPTDSSASPVGRYREPSVLPDGRILTAWADGPVNDLDEQSLTPPDFGIYVYDQSSGQNQLVYNDRATWDLNPIAVVARTEPPVIGAIQAAQNAGMPGTLGSIDITQTSLPDIIDGAEFSQVPLATALQSAVAVRVIEGFSSEAAPGVSMFGLTMDEGAAVLGEAKVYNDFSWFAQVPSYLPIHLQPIDKFGLGIRFQRLWIQTEPGEVRRCPGCHESRTGQGVPHMGQNPTVAEQNGAQPFTESLADRIANGEYGWDTRVQPVLTADCAGCHNASTTDYYSITQTDPVTGVATTYKIPSLDLSATPITVYYDKEVHTWPASYVSIFYPATLQMMSETGGTLAVTGTVPPMWGVPESARASALIEKINLRAVNPADGTFAWDIGTHPLHPEDQGVTVSDADRRTILVPMDLGGQYYARQNTGFVPYANDPVAATPTSN